MLISLALLSAVPARSPAAGVYEDVCAEAAFLTAPHSPGISGHIIRTDGNPQDASVYVIAVTYPARSWLLLEVEFPYVAVSNAGEIDSGIGDAKVRSRLGIVSRDGFALRGLATIRTGSGSRQYFPYASQTFDVELGLGAVDTLGVVGIWAMASGTKVYRNDDERPPAERHGDSARFGGGVDVFVAGWVAARVGASVFLYGSGVSRATYFSEVEFTRNDPVRLFAGLAAEIGDRSERVSDYAATAGVRIRF